MITELTARIEEWARERGLDTAESCQTDVETRRRIRRTLPGIGKEPA